MRNCKKINKNIKFTFLIHKIEKENKLKCEKNLKDFFNKSDIIFFLKTQNLKKYLITKIEKKILLILDY